MKAMSTIEKELLQDTGIIVEDVIGEGATSVVYSIKPYKGHKNMCIKYLWDARKKDVEEEFSRYKRLYQKEPKRFVKVVDLIWITVPDKNFPERSHRCAAMVMERLKPVNTLDTSIENIIKILHDSAICLSVMHILGYMHRDTKLDNLMFCERSKSFILVDFGLSCACSSTFTEDSRKGTLYYMAPESLKGQYSARSDFYSLGMIIRELLVGRREYELPSASEIEGQSVFDYMYEIKSKLKPLNSKDFSVPALINIINRCTAFRKEDRYSSYRQLVLDNKKLLSNLKLDLNKLTQSPGSVYLFAVSESINNSDIRQRAEDFFRTHHKNNCIIQYFSFPDSLTIHSLYSNDGQPRSAEIIVSDDSGFFRLLENKISKAEELSVSRVIKPEIYVCVIGSGDSRNRILNPFQRFFKGAEEHVQKATVFQISVANDYAKDVFDLGIQDMQYVCSPNELESCLQYWLEEKE